MNIAAMNKKVTFLRLSIVTDQFGNHRNTWIEAFTMFATISGESGNETNEAGLIIPKNSFSVTVRYCHQTANVTANDYRILLDGVQYNIRSTDHLSHKKHALKFICDKEGIGNVQNNN